MRLIVAIAMPVFKARDNNKPVSQMIMLATVDRLMSSLIADVAGVVLEACRLSTSGRIVCGWCRHDY